MDEFVTSGRIAELALTVMAAEFAALALRRRATGRGPSPARLAATFASGAALLVALRLALGEAAPLAIAGALLVAFAAHVLDLAGRWGD